VEVDFESSDYKGFVKEVLGVLESVRIKVGSGKEPVNAAKLLEYHVERVSGQSVEAEKLLERTLRFLYTQLKLNEEVAKEANVRVSGLHEVYENVVKLWEAAKDTGALHSAYRYCSMCGQLPAVTRIPRIDDRVPLPDGGSLHIVDTPEKKGSERDWTLEELLERLDYLVDEGEALCPYCLLRRILARHPWVAQRLVASAKRAKRSRISSTLDTANAWLRDEACEKVRKTLEGKPEEYVESVCEMGLEHILERLRDREESFRGYRRIGIVHGDGDMIGSGYMRGILISDERSWDDITGDLAKGSESVNVLLKRIPLLPENVVMHLTARIEASDARLVADAIPSLVYSYLLQLSATGGVDEDSVLLTAVLTAAVTSVLRGKNILDRGSWPLTIIPSPSYLRTFSTGLMVSSLVDALIIDSLGGVLVYAGGDDVLAIVPPAAPCKKLEEVIDGLRERLGKARGRHGPVEPVEVPGVRVGGEDCNASLVLAAVAYTRLNYWGLLGGEPGFHVYEDIVAQAPVAHGRSYGVNLVHYRSPLWASMRRAEELMEMKDRVKVGISGAVRCGRKDMVAIGFDGGLVGIVPQTLLEYESCMDGGVFREPMRVLEGIRLVGSVYAWVEGGEYSRSLVYDMLEDVNARLATLLSKRGRLEELAKFATSIMARNRPRRGPVSEEDERLVREITRVVLSEEERCKGREEEQPLLIHVFRAARNLLSASRR